MSSAEDSTALLGAEVQWKVHQNDGLSVKYEPK